MAKKKAKKRIGFYVTLVLLFGLFFYYILGYFLNQGKVLSSSNSNGGYGDPGGGNGNGYGNKKYENEDIDDDSGNKKDSKNDNKVKNKTNSDQIIIVSSPEQITSESISPVNNQSQNEDAQVIPAVTPTVTGAVAQDDREQNKGERRREEVIVSITQRSVLNENQALKPIATPSKSVLRAIEQKIRNVGSGEFLTSTKSTVKQPVFTSKEAEKGEVVGLGPDSSIFYSLIGGSNVLLGAVDKSDRRINVDDVELRSAELTMNKVLKKKGLDLGVSSNNNLVIVDGDVRAYFDMPVYVDVFSHDVQINTTDGKKKIVLTPSQALRAAKEVDSMLFDNQSMDVNLVYRSGSLSYKIDGKKSYMLFGKYPVSIKKTVFVDTESGEMKLDDDNILTTIISSASK